jgi:hypothetical protein
VRQPLADLPGLAAGEPGRAGGSRRQDDQAGPGVRGEADDLGRREVRGEVVDLPAVLAQAGRRHHGGQRVPLARRRRRDGDAAGAPLRLVQAAGDEPLADRGSAVLGGDGQLSGRPLHTDPPQRRGDDLVTQCGQRHSGGEAPEIVPGLGLVTVHQRRVQPAGLGGPVPDPDLPRRLGASRPPCQQIEHIAFAYLIAARRLPRGERPLPHPAIGGLVVHAKRLGRVP